MFADFDAAGINREKTGQYRDLDSQTVKFAGLQWRETRVAKGSALRAVNDAFTKRVVRFNYADTTTKFSANFQSYKNTAPLRKTDSFRADMPD